MGAMPEDSSCDILSQQLRARCAIPKPPVAAVEPRRLQRRRIAPTLTERIALSPDIHMHS
eukprot:1526388-Pyramimonas_sp.AAC.1